MPLPAIPLGIGSIIAVLLAGLRILLIANIAGFVLRLLFVLGFNFVVMEPIMDNIMSLLENEFGLLPTVVADWVKYLNFDKYVSIVLSAMGLGAGINFVLRLNR